MQPYGGNSICDVRRQVGGGGREIPRICGQTLLQASQDNMTIPLYDRILVTKKDLLKDKTKSPFNMTFGLYNTFTNPQRCHIIRGALNIEFAGRGKPREGTKISKLCKRYLWKPPHPLFLSPPPPPPFPLRALHSPCNAIERTHGGRQFSGRFLRVPNAGRSRCANECGRGSVTFHEMLRRTR